jgi:hypothetical protein
MIYGPVVEKYEGHIFGHCYCNCDYAVYLWSIHNSERGRVSYLPLDWIGLDCIGLFSDYFTLTSCQELIKSMSKTWQIVASIHEVDGLKQSFVSC